MGTDREQTIDKVIGNMPKRDAQKTRNFHKESNKNNNKKKNRHRRSKRGVTKRRGPIVSREKAKHCFCTLDLHQNTASQALSKVERFLPMLRSVLEDDENVRLITGQGNHSKKNRPIIKPVIETYLKQKGYGIEYENPGCLVIRKKGKEEEKEEEEE